MVSAFVLAKFRRRQAIVGGLGFGIVQQCRQRIVPFALRAGPSLKGRLEVQISSLAVFSCSDAVIGTAVP